MPHWALCQARTVAILLTALHLLAAGPLAPNQPAHALENVHAQTTGAASAGPFPAVEGRMVVASGRADTRGGEGAEAWATAFFDALRAAVEKNGIVSITAETVLQNGQVTKDLVLRTVKGRIPWCRIVNTVRAEDHLEVTIEAWVLPGSGDKTNESADKQSGTPYGASGPWDPINLAVSPPAIQWSADVKDPVTSLAFVDGGSAVLVGTSGGGVVLLDASTGKVKQRFELGVGRRVEAVGDLGADAQGRPLAYWALVTESGGQARFFALLPGALPTAFERWRTSGHASTQARSARGSFVGTTGKTSGEGGYLLWRDSSAGVHAIDAHSGDITWRWDVSAHENVALLASNRGDQSGGLIAFSPEQNQLAYYSRQTSLTTSAAAWRQVLENPESPPRRAGTSRGDGRGSRVAGAILDAHEALVAVAANNVWALSENDGHVLWNHDLADFGLEESLTFSVAALGTTAFVAASKRGAKGDVTEILAFDGLTGVLLWRQMVMGIGNALLPFRDLLLVETWEKTALLKPDDGIILWEEKLVGAKSRTAPPIAYGDMIVATAGPRTVVALGPTSNGLP